MFTNEEPHLLINESEMLHDLKNGIEDMIGTMKGKYHFLVDIEFLLENA